MKTKNIDKIVKQSHVMRIDVMERYQMIRAAMESFMHRRGKIFIKPKHTRIIIRNNKRPREYGCKSKSALAVSTISW